MDQKTKTTLYRIVLYVITFLMGGIGIAYEYTFSKVASDLLGNSVQQWAIIIGIMMLCMGLGADLQKRLSDRVLLEGFVLFEILLGLVGSFGPVLLLVLFGVARDHFVALQYGLTIAVGLLIGMEIPILARMNEKYTPQLKVNLGGVLRMDYIGAFCGALAWVFVLPRFFSLTEMAFFLGFLNIAVASLALLFIKRTLLHRAVLTVFVMAGFGAVTFGAYAVPGWTAHAEQHLYRDKVIFSHTTPYQHIVITRKPAGDMFCYINGNLQFSSIDEHIYHESLVHPAMHAAPSRRRVLVLGGGDGLAVREVRKYDDVESITLVDIDPAMIRLAKEHPLLVSANEGSLLDSRVHTVPAGGIQEKGRDSVWIRDRRYLFSPPHRPVAEVRVFAMDAAAFVSQVPGTYDVIIIDFPDPNTVELAKLYSYSFYRNLTAKLNRGGIIVQQSGSPFLVRESFLCVGRTMREAGLSAVPYHHNVPTFGEWGWWIAAHGEDHDESAIRGRLSAIDSLRVDTRYLTPETVRASMVFGRSALKATAGDINRITNNAVFHHYMKGLDVLNK